ncbi:pyrroloquinoline-quinone synthase PqqC [Actinokineospora sp. NBRC 105648]|uniref:pyrroloquinoline-quinone synthase PqqC n=1 Tax=Actinokineospora sp. NBRC 105648 TaxID=3032206 RepID=UPI0024A01E3E|nr:pyrroloquinoline-quinone synthase PqqC [Actinokineospora sp. NBRC 105648]GLZ43753.1 pyrroloquinoline-quinone synthase [Actinokineospora sp. NBRC 105648]
MRDSPLPQEEFLTRLRALSTRYWSSHPFHQRMHAGALTRAELRTWAANRWYYQSVLPAKDAAIVSNCPLPQVRRLWVDRIVYHDGAADGEGGREHWLRLCAALGLTRAEVLDERHVVPGVRFAVDAYVCFARTQPWVVAVAAGLTEMFSGHLMRRRVTDVLAHYEWITPADLAYFTTRVDAVADEGKQAVDLVLTHCTTRAQQDAAVAALGFKCDVLWSVLDAIDQAGRT